MEEKTRKWPWIAFFLGLIIPLYSLWFFLGYIIGNVFHMQGGFGIGGGLLIIALFHILLPIPLGLICIITGIDLMLTRDDDFKSKTFLKFANLILGVVTIVIGVIMSVYFGLNL